MPETTVTPAATGTTAAAPPATNGAPPAAPPAGDAAAKPAPQAGGEPPFLSDRLERDRRSVLKQLGFKPDKAIPAQKQIDEAAKKVEDLKKSRKEERKAREDAEAKNATLTAQVEALKKFADLEISALTPEQQAKVKAAAGDDPAEQLNVLGLLRSTFAPPAAAADPAKNGNGAAKDPNAGAPPQKTAPIPASTAQEAAPPPAGTSQELPLLEQWKQVNAIADPNKQAVARVQFLLSNGEQLLDAIRKT